MHGISYRPTDLSSLKEFSKKIIFKNFYDFIWTRLSRSSGSWLNLWFLLSFLRFLWTYYNWFEHALKIVPFLSWKRFGRCLYTYMYWTKCENCHATTLSFCIDVYSKPSTFYLLWLLFFNRFPFVQAIIHYKDWFIFFDREYLVLWIILPK